MSEAREAASMPEETQGELVCPFCGRAFRTQETLTDHFAGEHGMSDF